MLLFTALACAPKGEPSPPTFDEMNIGAMVEFHEDGGEENVRLLREWLVAHASDWAATDWPGGYTLGVVGDGELGSIAHSDGTIWQEVLGAGVPLVVRGDVDGFAEAAVEPDQTFADASTYIRWDRTITDGTADGFLDGEDIATDNVIEKSGPFGIVIPYEAKKDFRWFGDTLGALTWVPEEGWAEDDKNGIICGFTIELWFEEDGNTFFYNGSWTQIATVIGDEFPENVLVDEFIKGTIDYMEGIDAFVMGEYVPE